MRIFRHWKLLLVLKVVSSLLNEDQVQVVEFLDDPNCQNKGINIPVKDTISQEYLYEFTICAKFSVKFQKTMVLASVNDFHYLLLDSFENEMGFITLNNLGYMFLWQGKVALLPDKWHHLCYSYQDRGIWIVLDGKLLHDDITNITEVKLSTSKLVKNGFDLGIASNKDWRFSGLISDFNVWSFGLNLDNMKEMTNGQTVESLPVPDIVEWRNSIDVKASSECFSTSFQSTTSFFTDSDAEILHFIEDQDIYDKAVLKCSSLKGEMFIPKNENESLSLIRIIENSTSCKGALLGGKKTKDGNLVDTNRVIVPFEKWGEDQPNGRDIQQCIGFMNLRGDKFMYNDMECDVTYGCFACQIPKRQSYILRGSIPTAIDRKYQVNLENNPLEIRGHTHSIMAWSEGRWMIDNITWTNFGSAFLPPFGYHTWTFLNISKSFLFSQDDPGRFTCHKNGNLIPMSKRCDGRIDCISDNSDEEKCTIFNLTETYQKSISPNDDATLVNIQVGIQNVFDIDEVAMMFKARIQLQMEWYDPRITFQNLREDYSKNIIPKDKYEEIWVPMLYFGNSDDGQRTMLDVAASINVKRQGKGLLNPYRDLYQNHLYKGSENPLVVQRFQTVTLSCPFDLQSYPFDTQTCPITLAVPFDFRPKMNISSVGEPTHLNSFMFLQYEFLGLSDYNVSEDMKSVTINVNLRRIYSNHVVTTFLPTICLVVIAELTLFISIKHFEASIMVALTSMLVMYTLYQSISATLPLTAYMKMIDIWLFGGTILPFIVFVILVAVNILTAKEENNVSIDIEHTSGEVVLMWSKIIIPVMTMILIFTYWCFAVSM